MPARNRRNMTLRLSASERAMLEEAAAATGFPLGGYIRRAALDAASAVLAHLAQAEGAATEEGRE